MQSRYFKMSLWPVWKSKFYGAFVLNRRVVLHAIDATALLDGVAMRVPPRESRTRDASSAPDALVDFTQPVAVVLPLDQKVAVVPHLESDQGAGVVRVGELELVVFCVIPGRVGLILPGLPRGRVREHFLPVRELHPALEAAPHEAGLRVERVNV